MIQCRCTQAFVVISRHGGRLARQHCRNKARLVTNSCCTGKWRKETTASRFLGYALWYTMVSIYTYYSFIMPGMHVEVDVPLSVAYATLYGNRSFFGKFTSWRKPELCRGSSSPLRNIHMSKKKQKIRNKSWYNQCGKLLRRDMYGFFFALFQLTVSLQRHRFNVSGRLKDNRWYECWRGECRAFAQCVNAVEPNSRTKNQYPRVSMPISWSINARGSLWIMAPVLEMRPLLSWYFAGYWTLVDGILKNIYHIRSGIGYKRHA